jgi:hypothetical protein
MWTNKLFHAPYLKLPPFVYIWQKYSENDKKLLLKMHSTSLCCAFESDGFCLGFINAKRQQWLKSQYQQIAEAFNCKSKLRIGSWCFTW